MNESRPAEQDAPELVAAECEGSVDLQVDVGVLVAHAPETDPDRLTFS